MCGSRLHLAVHIDILCASLLTYDLPISGVAFGSIISTLQTNAFSVFSLAIDSTAALSCEGLFYENISRTPAVSSTNFGPTLTFASCVVGTCNILVYVWSFLMGGVFV